MEFDNILGNRQSQPETASRTGFVSPIEALENVEKRFSTDAIAAVDDFRNSLSRSMI